MPEFHINLGELQLEYARLDSFTQGYIEAAFFTESGEPENSCYEKSFSDLSPELLEAMIADCRAFQESFGDDLQEAYDQDKANYDANRAGNDFWYTRNGHGTGFWDRGLGEIGDKLSKVLWFGRFVCRRRWADLRLTRGTIESKG